MVKKETLYIVAVITFGLGFLAGVVVSAVRSVPFDDGHNHPPQQAASQAPQAQQENVVEAIRILEGAVAKEPGNYEAWVRLANSYFDIGQNKKAITAYDKALAINNSSANVWTDLGIMYRRTGQFDKAVESFSEGAKRDAGHIMSRMNLGIVYFNDIKDTPRAIAVWEEVLKLNPAVTLQDGTLLRSLVDQLNAAEASIHLPATGSGIGKN